ncbi:hypothetical protein [Nocardia asteroides]|uniref:hypothetical protein n=1 Tax=Nocardia asteroides TaxID=1824 RepID=UPI001E412E1C|nr:hypothetical protein [Nocardia asteroides]UGT64532.1 hypothetical protein LTT61_15135 [Nocardia asteroides]
MIFVGVIAWGRIRAEVDPPAEMRHATSTEVDGFEEVSLSSANIDRLMVTKTFIGPVVDRPQDGINSPGAAFTPMDRANASYGTIFLVHGSYRDGCFVGVHQIGDGRALRGVEGLSDTQRGEVARGEKIVLEMKFACGQG